MNIPSRPLPTSRYPPAAASVGARWCRHGNGLSLPGGSVSRPASRNVRSNLTRSVLPLQVDSDHAGPCRVRRLWRPHGDPVGNPACVQDFWIAGLFIIGPGWYSLDHLLASADTDSAHNRMPPTIRGAPGKPVFGGRSRLEWRGKGGHGREERRNSQIPSVGDGERPSPTQLVTDI
jgi:hypothetical protein